MRLMHWVHKEFQLNGRSFSDAEELIQFSEGVSPSLHTFLKDWFSEDDFVVVKTSGSTGKPKNIKLKKEHMKNSALATGEFFDVKEKTTALCCLPIEYIAGKMMVVRAMVLGWHLDVVEPNSSPLASINQSYDFSAMVPLQLRNSLDKIHLIKQLIIGGAAISETVDRNIQSGSTMMFATYGMTETITHIAVMQLNMFPHTPVYSYEDIKRLNRSYETLPNVSVSTDERNCLVIDAPKVSDEVIVTNDVVELVSPTEFIWKGRYDNVINSGGIKLHPEEIERRLAAHIKQRFFVIGVPDEQLGEKLVLVVEDKKSAITLNFDDSLTKYETPKEIFFVEEFIETTTGKIQRKNTLQKAQTY